MARIAGVDLPGRKHLVISLQYIYGVGPKIAEEICAKSQIDRNKLTDSLDENEVKTLREVIETYKVEGDLRREVALNVKRLIEIGSYRGMRHRRNLPSRGQRTKTNARQRRGPKKTVGARRKK